MTRFSKTNEGYKIEPMPIDEVVITRGLPLKTTTKNSFPVH